MSVSHIRSGSNTPTHLVSLGSHKTSPTVGGSIGTSHKTTGVTSGKQGTTARAMTKHPVVAVSHSTTPAKTHAAPKLTTIGEVGTKLHVTA